MRSSSTSPSASPSEPRRRSLLGRILRWTAWGFGGLLLVVALALLFLETGPGRRFLAETVSDLASGPGQSLQIENLEGSLWSELRIGKVVMADDEGAWLEVENARLDWSPGALLSGRLSVEALEASRVAMLRLPPAGEPAPPEPEEEGFALPQLPVEVRLDRLAVAEVFLGAPVLGQQATLSLEGSAELPSDAPASLALAVRRIDETPGVLRVNAAWDPASESLKLDLAGNEPAGGLLARVLQLPGLPAVELSLDGEGPLTGWSGDFVAQLDGEEALNLAVTISGADERAVAFEGRIGAVGKLPEAAQPWLGNGADLNGRLLQQGEILKVERLLVGSSVLHLDLAGSLDQAAGTLELSLEASLNDTRPLIDLVPDVGLRQVDLSLQASGPLEQPRLQGRVTLAEPAGGPAAADAATLSFTAEPQEAERYDLTLALDATAPRLTDAALPPWPWGDLRLEASGTADIAAGTGSVSHLTLAGQGLDATVDGTFSLPDGAGDLTLALNAAVPALPQTMQTPLTLALQGGVQSESFDQGLAADLGLRVEGTEKLPEGLGALIGSALTLDGRVSLDEAGTIAFSDLAVTGRQLSFTGDGSVGAATDVALKLSVGDLRGALAPFDLEGAGNFALEGRVALDEEEELAVDVTFSGEQVSVAGNRLGDLSGTIDLAGPLMAPAGTLTISAPQSAYGPIDLQATATPQQDGHVAVTPLKLALGREAELTGNLVADPAASTMTGKLEGRLAGGPLLTALGVPLEGTAQLSLDLTAPQGRQDATVSLTLGPGKLAGIAHGRGSVTAKAEDLLGALRLDAKATLADVAADPAQLSTVALTAKGSLEALDFTLATAGDLEGPTDLDVAGRLTLAEEMSIRLSRLEGQIAGLPLSLSKPATLRSDSAGLAAVELSLSLAEAGVELNGRRGGGGLTLKGGVTNLDLDQLARFFDDTVPSGRIDLALDLSGGSRAKGTVTLKADGLALRQEGLAFAPALDVNAEARLSGEQLSLDSTLAGDFGRDMKLTLALPFRLSLLDFSTDLPENGALKGQVAWEGEVAPLMDFLPLADQRLTGYAVLDVNLAGTLATPQVAGSLALTKGRYENLTTGTLLQDLTLRAEGEGTRLVIREARATDGEKGRLDLTGNVDLAGPVVDMHLVLTSFALLRRDDLYARMDGDLTLAGGDTRPLALAGRIEGQNMEIDIGADLPPEVATLENVVLVRDGVPVNPPKQQQSEEEDDLSVPSAPFVIQLDLVIDLPRRVFVRGNGLESEWAGKLNVGGTTANPIVTGGLSPQRGQFSLLGSIFELDNGRISFDGGSVDPLLDLTAVHEKDDFIAKILITGRGSHPEFELTSEPALPQDEVLARVLFSRGTGQLSAVEAVQLADALAILSGQTKRKRSMVEIMRTGLGLDVFRVEGGEEAQDVTATLGKYVADGVFLGVKQGTAPGSTAATVEVDLFPNVKLEGTAGADSSTSVGIRWQWDY